MSFYSHYDPGRALSHIVLPERLHGNFQRSGFTAVIFKHDSEQKGTEYVKKGTEYVKLCCERKDLLGSSSSRRRSSSWN